MAIIAVHRNEELRSQQVGHQAQFFLAAVSADVDQPRGTVVVDNLCVAAVQVIDYAENALLVAGNHARAENNRVSFLNVRELVIVHRRTRQRAHRLALGAADHHHYIMGWVVLDLSWIDQQTGGNVDVAQVLSDLRRLHHGAANNGHLALVQVGQFQRNADAVDGGGEAAEEQLAFGSRENLVQARANSPLAGRVAGAVDVGRVLQQRQHTALAVLGKRMEIERLAIRRRKIDLEVARVDHHSDRRFNCQSHAVHEAMSHADRLHREWTNGEFTLGLDLDQLGLVQQLVLFKLALDVGQRELRCVDGHVQLAQDPGQATNMILVTVGQNDGANALPVLHQVGDVRDHDVNAQQFCFRKHQAGVDDDDVVLPAEREAIHAKLAQTTQRNNL